MTRARHIKFIIPVLIGIVLAPASPEPWSVFASFASLGVIFWLLWGDVEPPIFLMVPLMQWSQVALVPISTIWLKMPMADYSKYGGQTPEAAIYGLLGVVALSLGGWYGLRAYSGNFARSLRQEAHDWSTRDALLVSMVAIIVGSLMELGTHRFGGGLVQAFIQGSAVKYGGLFMLVYWSLVTGRALPVMVSVVFVEAAMGMTGFFGEFMHTFLIVGIAAISARTKWRPSDFVIIGAVSVTAVAFGIFWSAVKSEYRSYVSLGTGAQIVAVPFEDRVNYLLNKVDAFDAEDLELGLSALVSRHGYTEFLGLTLQYVPESRPHEVGTLTAAAVGNILTPRVLFPWKAPLPHDTDIMVKYTGLPMAWDIRTSISIGHLGEFYIDFGYVGGLLAMAGLGFFISRLYILIRNRGTSPFLLRAALCCLVVMPAAYFGTALAKVLGGVVFATIISVFTQRIALPILFGKIIKKNQRIRIVRNYLGRG